MPAFHFSTRNFLLRQLRRGLSQLAIVLFPNVPVHCELSAEELEKPTLFVIDAASVVDYALLAHYLWKRGYDMPLYIDQQHCAAADVSALSVDEDAGKHRHYIAPMQLPSTAAVRFGRWIRRCPEVDHLQPLLEKLPLNEWNIVPVLCVWSKEPERLVPSWADRTFGSSIVPGYFRKVLQMLVHRHEIRLHIGNPLQFDETAPPKLKKQVSKGLAQLRRAATGPRQKWKSRIIDLVLRDENLVGTMNLLARREATTIEEQQSKARKILHELAAEYSVPHTGFLGWCLQQLYNIWYESLYIDMPGLDAVRKAASQGAPLILLPMHKSHMDYLVISKIFFSYGIHPPHIAAGINLSFWPFGYFFRKAGAYFIRRKIQSDLLYARILEAYVRRLVREGYNQEFFIEGGRSRDGKLIDPQLGILGITVDAFYDGACNDLNFVPISIVYDKVLEDESYAAENRGAAKEKETLWSVIKSLKKFRHRYGNVYVEFGAPISIASMRQELQQRNPESGKRQLVRALTSEVTKRLNTITPVTPTALVALALLTSGMPQSTAQEIARSVRRYLQLLRNRAVRVSPLLNEADAAVQRTLQMLVRFKAVQIAESGTQILYSVAPERRLLLAYYKNSCLHHLLPEAMYSLALHACHHEQPTVVPTNSDLLHHLETLHALLQGEFVDLSRGHWTPASLLEAAQQWFAEAPMAETVEELRRSLLPLLESALTAGDFLVHDENPRQLLPEAGKLLSYWRQLQQQGRIIYPESGTVLSLNNAYQTVEKLTAGDKQHAQLLQQLQRYLEENSGEKSSNLPTTAVS